MEQAARCRKVLMIMMVCEKAKLKIGQTADSMGLVSAYDDGERKKKIYNYLRTNTAGARLERVLGLTELCLVYTDCNRIN
jgi:hypothetical protein